jgi:transposase
VLEDANSKLATVVRDVMGVSGRAMLEALAQGVTDPERHSLRSPRLGARAAAPEAG